MEALSDLTESADVWTTPQAAEFLDISRQAINKRIQNRKMLGYAGNGMTLFPVWQFDLENRRVRREVPKFLAAFDENIEPHAIARWSTTKIDEFDRTPAEMLLCPNTAEDALRLAGACTAGSVDESAPPATESGVKRTGQKVAEWRPSRAGSSGAQHDILLAAADLFSRKPGESHLARDRRRGGRVLRPDSSVLSHEREPLGGGDGVAGQLWRRPSLR